eukprot:760340-Hanusia_phi.AAC.6
MCTLGQGEGAEDKDGDTRKRERREGLDSEGRGGREGVDRAWQDDTCECGDRQQDEDRKKTKGAGQGSAQESCRNGLK